jgi:methylated-DNA-protein-cysteine methyltransferase-like protein
MNAPQPLYQKIYDLVRQIPPGKVATYGQIARLVGGCTPRMVGYAMAAVPNGSDVPWQRVINSRGGISPRANPFGEITQRLLLEEEGVHFNERDLTDLDAFGWIAPDVI